MTELIKLKDLSKAYKMGDEIVNALQEIDIIIEKGEFVAIMGPSGSGKSTMMNMVGALDKATKGDIFLEDFDIEHLDESQLSQIRGKKIGFIFQGFNLIPNLTAKENVALPMLFQDEEKEDRERKVEELLKEVDLEDRQDHYPNQLSGGQQQRVAIARALANNPEIILADEPTGNLDTKTGKMVMDFLQNLNKKGRTIIMVTHDPDLAKEYAKTIYTLKDGKIDKKTRKKRDKWVSFS